VFGVGFATGGGWPLDRQQPVFIDFGCTYRGWFSDAGLTILARDFDPLNEEKYWQLHGAIATGARAAVPGVRASFVQARMAESLGDSDATLFPHGHGIGLEVREHPLIVPCEHQVLRDDCVELDADLLLEPGMVFSLEVSSLTPGKGSMGYEQSFVVREDGAEALLPDVHAEPLSWT
jgi:Xaa-Pro aminopeptidase